MPSEAFLDVIDDESDVKRSEWISTFHSHLDIEEKTELVKLALKVINVAEGVYKEEGREEKYRILKELENVFLNAK